MRAFLFALLCLVFSPLVLVGSLAFAFKVRFVNMRLEVESFESLGRESGRGTPIGGLILAAVPDQSVADRA